MSPVDPEGQSEADVLLREFIAADDPACVERLLCRLLTEYADPIICKIVRAKLHRQNECQDAEDVRSQVHLQLLSHLNKLRLLRDTRAVGNFIAYVITTTYNACNAYVRNKHPAWSRFKNTLRYLLTHRPEFDVWEDKHGQLVCGLKEWRGRAAEDPTSLTQTDLSALVSLSSMEQSGGRPTCLLVETLLRVLGRSVFLDQLADLMARILGVHDPLAAETDDKGPTSMSELVPDCSPDAAMHLEQTQYLARLWNEICALSINQRLALLLNLRVYGGSALDLFIETGVASVGQIAEVFNFQSDTLAALWNQLPLDDNSIAALMGIQRQQVINLRKSARERLQRRMREKK